MREATLGLNLPDNTGMKSLTLALAFGTAVTTTAIGLGVKPALATIDIVVDHCLQCTANDMKIIGLVSENSTITVKDKNGKVIWTGKGPIPPNKKIRIPPNTPGPVTVESSEDSDPSVNLLPVIQPLMGTTSRTTHTISSGSQATFGAMEYSLTGSFSAFDTNVIYEETASNYGEVTGAIPASSFHVNGSNSNDFFSLRLTNDGEYKFNLASAWSTVEPGANTIVPFSIPIVGEVSFNGSQDWIPFIGTAVGSVTFSDPLQESVALSFALETQAGSLTGTIFSNGVADCSVPEPTSTLSLLALGTLGAASTLKRKLKSSKSSEKETTKVG
ncbi:MULTISPECIES: PEP-CTERM sorting domain-containing protein [Microcystis]|uniref:PEP-CTERM sorting domain-containing protein n=1 Tax=Microcystis TaxID=1125 RepID=UPI001F54F697|nr:MULTISPECIES: PEP-CTERM sorting domain-containing protein [Microcystis]UZO78104.1 PEP-CTERM sorting domain-containing protein [Microcystis aeruginosa str. Chao 1910]